MKATRLVGPRQFAFEEIEEPAALKDGEVLARTEYFSICGSDLRTYDRVLPEEDYPMRHGGPCHETLAIVEESRAEHLRPGQRVIALQTGMLERAVVPAHRLIPVPSDGMDPALWVLCQPVGTVMYSIQEMGTFLGKTVAVLGQGPIGLAFTDFLVRGGARKIIVSDLLDYRLDLAKKLGATHTVNAGREDIVDVVKQATGDEMVDIAVEACGRPETCGQLFEVLRMQGTAMIFGLTHDEDAFHFDWNAMMNKLPRIVVTNSARSGDMARTVSATVELVSQGRLSIDHLLTHQMGWQDVNRAYEMYSAKQDNSLKIVMKA